MKIKFTINGMPHSVELAEEATGKNSPYLLPYLRSRGLTAAKDGCSIGACGTCTVVVEGLAKRACRIKLESLEGKEVLTLEGITSADGSLHPIQQAFVDAGAIQCGFCTPGMVMTTYALLQANKNPSEAEIKKALTGNLCRCTGYVNIIKAVQLAAKEMAR